MNLSDTPGPPLGVAEELAAWASGVRVSGEPLPAYYKKPRHAWADRIAIEAGLPPDALKSRAGRALLTDLAEDVGLRVVTPPSMSPNLARWAEAARAAGRPLPANAGEPATPCIKHIARLARVTERTLLREPGRSILASVIEAVGLAAEVRLPPAFARWVEERRKNGRRCRRTRASRASHGSRGSPRRPASTARR